jgi:hypothetical protein
MKKTFLYTITILTLLSVLSSCKKDFLDRYPQTSIPPDLFFKSEQDLALCIIFDICLRGGSFVGDQNTDDKATTGFRR